MTAAEPFDIDARTGQITTNRALDFDETLDSPVDPVGDDLFTAIMVVVMATDPDGEQLDIRVDIRITDVDEAPLFAHDLTREANVMENSAGDDLQIGTYAADSFAQDPDDTTTAVIRTIGGDDAGLFAFAVDDVLQFAASPDYENPVDDNEDNLYELTVVAEDATGMTSSLAVTVKVTNDPSDDDDNEAGSVEIFNRQPEVNTVLAVTGDPTDPDGNVRSVKWQWYWQTIAAASATAPAECPAFVATIADPNSPGTAGDPDLNDGSLWMKIDGATSSSYMPTLDRTDDFDTDTTPPDSRTDAAAAFDCLMVRASYLDDGPRPADDPSTKDYDESRQYAYGVSEFSVQPADTDNVAPVFADGDTALGGVQVRVRVQENFAAGPAIFNVVGLASPTNPASAGGDFLTNPTTVTQGTIRVFDGTVSDADNSGTTDPFEVTTDGYDDITDATTDPIDHKLTFSMDEAGAENFELVSKATGAVNFTGDTDYEVPAQRRYEFTLTAHDPTNATGSITVIFDVENVDEPPTFTDGDGVNRTEVDFNENGEGTVATYTGFDPESDRYFWGLTGTDAALFDIGVINGRLTFKKAPTTRTRKMLLKPLLTASTM